MPANPKLIVTITPPTPNGDLHIGHIAGPFLSADVFTRVQRQQGYDCVFVSYSDDYQSYMKRKGLEVGRDPLELANENTGRIKATLRAADIDIDHWMSSYGNPYFLEAALEIHEAASRRGVIERHASQEPYCPKCRTWGYEAFGRGNCNYCGVDSDASQCENCAYPPEAALMSPFRCKVCGGEFEWPSVEREFLQIARYEEYLRGIYHRKPLRRPMDAWADEVLRSGPREWGMTRPEEAGLDLKPDGSCRLHTWFLGICGYIAAVHEYADKIAGKPEIHEAFWKRDDVRLVHFLGHDCAYSHMVVYPALLSNLEGGKPVPQFYPNQFMKLNGENLSTSRNHAIWAKDLIAEYGSDASRLYLALVAPEEFETNFDVETFRTWYRSVFVETIGALVDRTRQERATAPLQVSSADDQALLAGFRDRWRAAAGVDTFSMRALAQLVLDLVAIGRDRMAVGNPVAHIVEEIGVLGSALHPELSQRIAAAAAPSGAPAQPREPAELGGSI